MTFIVSSSKIGPSRIGYKNLFESVLATVTASTEASGYAKENAYDGFGYDSWKPTATGDSWLRVSFGSAQLSNYMAVWGHNLADHGASVKPQYSTDGGATWIDAASAVAPATNRTLLFTWDDITAADKRLLVNCPSTIPVISGVQIGEVMTLPSGMKSGFAPSSLAPKTINKTAQSESGAFIGGSRLRQGIEGDIKLSVIDPTWIRDVWAPFIEHVQTPKPFVWSWDNDTHPNEVVLAWVEGEVPVPTYSSPLYMDASLKFKGNL